MTSKSWIYTINNYDQEVVTKLEKLVVTKHRCCAEIGEAGTPHLQGAITFKRSYRLAALKKLFPAAHFEISKTKDAENYCIKGDILIDVSSSEQGSRSDLSAVAQAVKSSKRLRDIASEYPDIYIKYHRGIERLAHTLQEPTETWTPTTVSVLWGMPGVGKSKKAREIDPALYNVAQPEGNVLWFDGYMGERTILLDDFYGWIQYHRLLQLCDGYPLRLQVKGGWVHRNWNHVIITSNKPPEHWYKQDIAALERRITTCELIL